jgi:hypothetical protein
MNHCEIPEPEPDEALTPRDRLREQELLGYLRWRGLRLSEIRELLDLHEEVANCSATVGHG